jgi:hypothetical protein
MRELAVALGVTSPKVPLEYQVWNALIEQIQKAADDKIIGTWAEPSKSNARAFFRRTLSDLYSFKDDVRNILMHTRSQSIYDGPRTISVWNRTIEFSDRVGGNIAEGGTSPLFDPSRFL